MEHPKHILERHGLSAKKSLGQNFLHDDHLLARIVQAAELTKEDEVLEIGPGLGALTRHLATAARRVVAVELDSQLMPILHQNLAGLGNVELIHGDILDWKAAETFTDSYKVVANVPYYITGAILRHVFSEKPPPGMIVLTVQREVADRLVAPPGEMSLLSAVTQYYGDTTVEMKIRAGAFWPAPEVDSALVRIALRPGRHLSPGPEQRFFDMVRAGFQQRRKQLQKNLRGAGYSGETVAAAMASAGIRPKARAQSLSVEDWLALFAALTGA